MKFSLEHVSTEGLLKAAHHHNVIANKASNIREFSADNKEQQRLRDAKGEKVVNSLLKACIFLFVAFSRQRPFKK